MMWKQLWLIATAIAVVFIGGAALAQGTGTSTAWEATYWNNATMAGDPVLTRTESELNHNWGFGAPQGGVEADRFSARWTTTLQLPAGRYLFTATVDDGIRVWIDERLLINSWRVQSPRTFEAEIEIEGGEIPVRVEYFENIERALIQLSWSPIRVGTERWYAEFFDNRSLQGTPILVRNDTQLNFNWGEGSPAPDTVEADTFSARWRRTLDLERGLYRFRVIVDDGARLWVDDQLFIDSWRAQPATLYEAEIFLTGGSVPVRLEYFENGGLAQIALDWTRIAESQPTPTVIAPPPPPLPGPQTVVIIDNNSPNFISGGSPDDDWTRQNIGYNNDLIWTYNSDRLPTAYNWAQWQPLLEPGRYEVSVYVPREFATSSQARYWIGHVDGPSLRIVDQAASQGRWIVLGTYNFDGSGDYVSLADVTFEENSSARVAYDAVRWTPVNEVTSAEPALSVSETRVSPGERVTVYGTGFPAATTVQLTAGPPNTEPFAVYGQARTDRDGTVRLSFVMPTTWPDGQPIVESLPPGNELVFLLIGEDGTKALKSVTFVLQ